MANKQTRSPGRIVMPTARAAQRGSVPSWAADTGAAWRVLADVGDSFSKQMLDWAADAARQQGRLAGLDAGQQAGASYVGRRAAEERATARLTGLPTDVNAAIATAASRYGVSAQTLQTIAAIESGGRADAKNPHSSAGGLFQFTDATARRYGLKDRYDPNQAADAAARLTRDNAAALTAGLGRAPTPGELYLAHQQGAQGALDLLINPDAKAASIVGADAVRLNGGNAAMTAGAFARKWTARAGDTDAPATPPVPAGELSTMPLQLRSDATIRGDAFNRAAIRSYSWRVSAGLNQDLTEAYQDNEYDPAGYTAATQKIRAAYLSDENLADPRLREAFDQEFVQSTQADRLKIAANREADLRAQELASVSEAMDAQGQGLERAAYNLGANGDAEAVLAPQLREAAGKIDSAVNQHLLSPAAAQRQKDELGRRVVRAQVQGTFDQLPDPQAKERFANTLLEDWAAGKGPVAKLDYATAHALSATLYASARSEANRMKAAARGDIGKMKGFLADDIASMAATGQGVMANGKPLDPATVSGLVGPDATAKWQADREQARRVFAATSGMEADTPQEIADRLAALEPVAGKAGFVEQQQIHETAVKRAREVLKQRQTDPLGQAMRAGIVKLSPIATDTPEALQQSLDQRRQDALAVANAYDMPPVYFRPQESAALASGLMDNPDLLPQFAASVGETFGQDAPKVLSELSAAGPAIAHAAALGQETGDMSVATDISRVLAGRKDGTYKVKMPSDSKFAEAANAQLGATLSMTPGTRSAAVEVAQLLYERDAQLRGFDPGDVNVPDTTANASFQKALDRALGASMHDGEKFGGLAEVNGMKTVAPPDMPASMPQALIGAIRPEDLAAIGPIGTGNGVAISAGQLRSAKLVAVGDGHYLMALGDPASADPQFVPGDGPGGFFVLDIRKLEAAENDRPAPGKLGGAGIGRLLGAASGGGR